MAIEAHFVRAARERLGLTQTEFGDLLGVTKRTVIRWEQGSSLKQRDRLAIRRLAANADGSKMNDRLASARKAAITRKLNQEARKLSEAGHKAYRTKKRRAAARKAHETRGPHGRSASARKAAITRKLNEEARKLSEAGHKANRTKKRRAAARKANETRGPHGRSAAARKAARTRAHRAATR
jgi:transcriptional regulator with XRE-family HTH domain